MKRVTHLLNAQKDLPDDCRACVVRQFARKIPVGDQLACVASKSGGRGPLALPADQPVSAVKLLLKVSLTAEKASFLSKDLSIYPPLANTPNDPTLFGAMVELCSTQGHAMFDLPANFWRVNGAGSVFKFVQPGTPAGVKVALIKGGRTLKVVSKAVGLPLLGGEGPVGVRVTTGDTRNCAWFAADTIVRDEAGKYIAQGARAEDLADCSDASLGCPAGP